MAIEDDIAALARVPGFGTLGRDALRLLAIGSDSQVVRRGETLFRKGDPADSAFLVQSGSIELGGDAATKPITMPRGALIDDLALLIDGVRSETATAPQQATVIRIPRALFLKMLDGYPEAAARLRDAFAERAAAMIEELKLVRDTLTPK